MTNVTVNTGEANEYGYKPFSIGEFNFSRDEHFVHVTWPSGTHVTSAEPFLKALTRDVAWNFFYGTINFDSVLGTTNHYGNVDLFAGRFNEAYRKAEIDHLENFPEDDIKTMFTEMLSDWTNASFDPFAAPMETGSAFGSKLGNNDAAVTRTRVTAKRMVGLPGDEKIRTDESGYPVNRAFQDVDQSEPLVEVEPGYEDEVSAYNFFAYLSRSDVTWNPSVVSVCKDSLYCPTTEEFILPVIHGNDRVEWFIQLSDEIIWEVEDGETGTPRAKVVMKAGDCATMPADIRHRGYSPKRSMLLVWENNSPAIPDMIARGEAPVVPVKF